MRRRSDLVGRRVFCCGERKRLEGHGQLVPRPVACLLEPARDLGDLIRRLEWGGLVACRILRALDAQERQVPENRCAPDWRTESSNLSPSVFAGCLAVVRT